MRKGEKDTMKIFEQVQSKQLYAGSEVVFDPDASPQAWDYYEKIYQQENWPYLATFHFAAAYRCFFHWDASNSPRKNYNYLDKPVKTYNRLEVASITNLGKEVAKKRNGNSYRPYMFRFGGETDFNFNRQKMQTYKALVASDEAVHDQLNKASMRHHTLLNFSIMPVPGNLQGIKSEGVGDWLDRPDSLVYLLDDYFIHPTTTHVVLSKSRGNKEALVSYLATFINGEPAKAIETYCAQVYCIYGEITYENKAISASEYVKMLREHGQHKITTTTGVQTYLMLAEIMWQFKQKHFEQVVEAEVAAGEGSSVKK